MGRRLMIASVVAAVLVLALLAGLAAAALADGPTLWKEYCPRHHDVVLMAADDWDGVHVLCVRAARPEEPTDKVR